MEAEGWRRRPVSFCQSMSMKCRSRLWVVAWAKVMEELLTAWLS
jgi:hypothetical protein